MLKHLISDASRSVARALRKGSQLLGTLAYLLHPEGGYEGSETPSRGSDPPEEDDSPSFPVGGEFAIPPDAEQMIAKPLPPPPRMPDAPLAGSIKDRMKGDSWAEQYRRLREYDQTTLEGFPDRHGSLQSPPGLFRSLPKEEFDRLPRPSREEIREALDKGRPRS